MGKTPINDEHIQLLYEKLKQKSEYSQIVKKRIHSGITIEPMKKYN